MRLIVFICLFFVFAITSVFAQSEYKIQYYDVGDGLSQGSVYSYFKDHLGYMWMSSYEGLNRFDGKTFTVFREKVDDSLSIMGNDVIGIVQDPNHNLWIGSEKCLNRYVYGENQFEQLYVVNSSGDSIRSDHFPFYADSSEVWYMNNTEGIVAYNYKSGTKDTLAADLLYQRNYFILNAAKTDNKGQIWVRRRKGVISIDRRNQKRKIHYVSKFIRCHYIDRKDNVWLESNWEIIKMDSDTLKPHQIYSLPKYITSNVIDIVSLSDSLLWVATGYQGLLLINIYTQEIIEKIDRFESGKKNIPTSTVSNLHLDSDNLLWASNDPKGVFVVVPDNQPFALIKNFHIDDQEIRPGGFRSFCQAKDGTVYVGSEDEGLFIFDPITGKIQARFLSGIYPEQHASSLMIDQSNHLYVGSYRGLYRIKLDTRSIQKIENSFYKGSNESNLIWNVVEDHYGHIYFSTDAGVYAWHEGEIYQIPVFKNEVTGLLYIDNSDYLYIPRRNNGFATIHIDSLWDENHFNTFAQPIVHQFDFYIKSFHQSENILWLCTTNGLYKLQSDSKRQKFSQIKHYTSGFPSFHLYGALEDDKKNLWISSNRGIVKFNPVTEKMIPYTTTDGLQGYEYNTNTFLKLKSGDFLFGGVDGMNFFDPSKIKEHVDDVNQPHISHITFGDGSTQLIPQNNRIKISSHQSNFSIHYVIPQFISTKPIEYEYRINDGLWLDNNSSNTITFNQLHPGNYTVDIRAINLTENNHNESGKISLHVLPPWYKTTWLRLILTALFGLMLYTLYKWRTVYIRAQERLQSRIRNLQLDALQSQMNPHFIFNCLNTVDSYIASNDQINASNYLNAFAKLIRSGLSNSRQNLITLKEEIDFISTYIQLEQKRFTPSFNFNIRIDHPNKIKEIKIPPLLIQPIVENAIWHGISKIEDIGILEITDNLVDDEYVINIADNGPGFDTENKGRKKEKSYGMDIINQRIELYNATTQEYKITTHVKSQIGEPTTVAFRFLSRE